jgi:OOP family OmpA-OmpF porin
MKIYIRLISFLLLISGSASAQFIQDNKRIADAYFKNKQYYSASQFYLRALNNSRLDSTIVLPYPVARNTKHSKDVLKEQAQGREDLLYMLAESYRLYNNYQEAEKGYMPLISSPDPKFKLASFWYAKSLRANRKYGEAITNFENFLKNYKENDDYKRDAEKEIVSCRFAFQELKYPRLVKVQKMGGQLNGSGSNYAPFRVNNLLYFTSSRSVITSAKKRKPLYIDGSPILLIQKADPFINTVYSVLASTSFDLSTIAIAAKNQEAAASTFTADGKYMYYTAWSEKDAVKYYSIYRSELDASGKRIPGVILGNQVNLPGYNAKQPNVTADGKYLLFSSNRPGGMGKYDLWYCPIDNTGAVGQAISMGSAINTIEDEEAPFYNILSGKLIFSSNGMVGLGGFDFYQSDGNFLSWTTPANMGYPFNSSKDDIYFAPSNAAGTEGYISSDRESECCLELFTVKIESLAISGSLLDCERGTPLKGALVTFTDSLDQSVHKAFTDENGIYRFTINSRRPFKLAAEKENYFTKSFEYNTNALVQADTLFSPKLCLTSYKVDVPIVLKEVFYDFGSAELTDPSKAILDNLNTIMVDNPTIIVELSAHTDSIGTDQFNADLSQKRAESCVNYLIVKGIPETRLKAQGYGKSRPVAPNSMPDGKDNPGGRQLNRRTEFKVLSNK